MPYVVWGVALWACVYTDGLHSTLAGIILAAFIATRPPPDFPKRPPVSSYFVLPVFALANAGVAIGSESFNGRGLLMLSIVAGLTIGKPLGFALASALAVGLHLAERPRAYTWRQLTGAGALAGVGFTMSLFIAGQAFPRAEDFAVAKIAVFAASMLWPCQARPSLARIRVKGRLDDHQGSCPNGSVWTGRWRRLIDSASTSCHPTPRHS